MGYQHKNRFISCLPPPSRCFVKMDDKLQITPRNNTAKAESKMNCTICYEEITFTNWWGHIRKHSREKSIKCFLCPNIFTSIHDLNNHMKFHKEEMQLECTLCDYKSVISSRMKQHLNSHFGKQVTCKICEASLKEGASLINHMRKMHRTSKTISCVECGKKFGTVGELKGHMIVHNGIYVKHVKSVAQVLEKEEVSSSICLNI